MTNDTESLTVKEMRDALPGMILSLTDRQAELVLLAIQYVRQGMPEEAALQKAYEEMNRQGAA